MLSYECFWGFFCKKACYRKKDLAAVVHYQAVIYPNAAVVRLANSRRINHFNLCNKLLFVNHLHIDVASDLAVFNFSGACSCGASAVGETHNSGVCYGHSLVTIAVTPAKAKQRPLLWTQLSNASEGEGYLLLYVIFIAAFRFVRQEPWRGKYLR
jgi:hypothetical protein